jgi:diguanylate cyclase (GGDEF)-like protein/PAS domain S-box-containing protein
MQVHAPLVGPSEQLWAHTGALVVLVDGSHRVVAANPAACAALGLAEHELVGRDAVDMVVPREVADFRHELRAAARSDVPATCEHELRTVAEDDRRAIAWSISRTSLSPAEVGCIGVDVTAARNDSDVLRERAVTDELTGLANRSGLRDHLSRMAGSGASVVFCDLNGFKAVNDAHGHDVGDAVLVQVARRLKRTVRGEDFVARIGGDEFVIVAPPDTNSDFDMLARRILRATDQPMILPGPIVATVGMSIGMAVLEPGTDPTAVLTLADHDMYRMKSRRITTSTDATPVDSEPIALA